MRVTAIAFAVSVAIGGLAVADDAKAAVKKPTSIVGQQLGSALRVLAKDREFHVLFRADLVRNVHTAGAVGVLTTDEALTQLLSGTALDFQYLDERTITIVPAASMDAAAFALGENELAGDGAANPREHATNAASVGLMQLAQASQEARDDEPAPAAAARNSGLKIEEVLVTARKKLERLQDVPIPLTVISADELVRSSKMRLRDYFSQVPGLSVQTDGSTVTTVSIRGLSLGTLANPTVGITVDDVAPGSSTFLGGGAFVPEIDPSDLESIEVLRGPQGSLYGAASPSGLIRYVTADPSLASFSGRVRLGTSMVKNGDDAGYNVNGSINVPLSDTFAVRASAVNRREPGFVDNPVRGTKGLNESRTYGGGLSALWAPSDAFSLRLNATYEDNEKDGNEDVLPSLGEFKQDELAGTGFSGSQYQAYTARVRAKLGIVNLTSVTGYHVRDIRTSIDSALTYAGLDGFTEDFFGVPNDTTGVATNSKNRISKFTQELRLEMPLGRRVDWLLGGFYGRERNNWDTGLPAIDRVTGVVAADWGHYYIEVPYEDTAVFTDFNVHVTDRFDVQIGGRQSRTEQSYYEIDYGPFVPVFLGVDSPYFPPRTEDTANAFTYSVTPRLKVSQDLMTYVRVASGYSPGGSNANADLTGVPKSYKPSTTLNYEFGVKGALFDNRLVFDASVYYIDWKDIPVTLVRIQESGQANSYTGNGGGAKTQGVELSVQLRPTSGLTIGGWIAYTDAHLTEAFPASNSTYGARGDQMPYAIRRSGNLSVDQEFPLGARMTGSVGGTVSYVGRHLGDFTSSPPDIPPRQVYPGYTTFDLRASLNFLPWAIDLYANNLTDKRALQYGGDIGSPTAYPGIATFITPRSIGLSVNRTF